MIWKNFFSFCFVLVSLLFFSVEHGVECWNFIQFFFFYHFHSLSVLFTLHWPSGYHQQQIILLNYICCRAVFFSLPILTTTTRVMMMKTFNFNDKLCNFKLLNGDRKWEREKKTTAKQKTVKKTSFFLKS